MSRGLQATDLASRGLKARGSLIGSLFKQNKTIRGSCAVGRRFYDGLVGVARFVTRRSCLTTQIQISRPPAKVLQASNRSRPGWPLNHTKNFQVKNSSPTPTTKAMTSFLGGLEAPPRAAVAYAGMASQTHVKW